MNVKERQKAESKERILKSASQLFGEKGYQATGVDELMEKAGLTAGAFYAHFKSKQKLLEECLAFSMVQNRKVLLTGLENLKGLEFVENVVGRYVSKIHRDNPKTGCPLPAVGPELYRNANDTGSVIDQYLEGWVALMKEHLKGSESEKRSEALRLFAQSVGAILLSRQVGSDSLSKEILIAAKKVSNE